MAHLVVREVRGLRYWSVRDGQGRQLAWIGRDPSPETLAAAVHKHGIDLHRYTTVADRVGLERGINERE